MPTRPSKIPKEHHLDAATIEQEFDAVMESVYNKIQYEWPQGKGNEHSLSIVWGHVRLAYTNYRAMRYFCAERPKDFARKPEYVLAAPPIARSIVDILANLIYLFEDLSERTWQYLRAGWQEDYEHFLRDKEKFKGREGADEYLSELEARIEEVRRDLAIDEKDVNRGRLFWPIISQMRKDKNLDSRRKEFLDFIWNWFYKDFSAAAHLSGPGLYHRANFLLKPQHKLTEEDLDEIAGHRSDVLMPTMALMLCIAAEVEIELRLGMAERIIRLWTRINFSLPDLKEIYDRWYATRLPPPV